MATSSVKVQNGVVESMAAVTERGRWAQVIQAMDKPNLDMFELDGELLRDAIAAVVLEGDAILFGMTTDQGAVSTKILAEDGGARFYSATTEALEITLRAIRDAAKA